MSTLHPYVSVTVLSVGESACANTSSVRVRIYVTEVDVGRCPYAIYCVAQGMGDGITTFVSYSPKVHCTASIPRDSPGFDVARWILGRLSLQLLPLVSNKHPISLSDRACVSR